MLVVNSKVLFCLQLIDNMTVVLLIWKCCLFCLQSRYFSIFAEELKSKSFKLLCVYLYVCECALTHACSGVGWGRVVVAIFNIPELLCNHECVGAGWRVEGQEWVETTGKQTWMPSCMQNKADACTIAPLEFHQAQEVLKMLYIQGPPWSNGGKKMYNHQIHLEKSKISE